MDVKYAFLILGFLFLSACGQPKTTASVFKETSASECPGTSRDNRYIVEWENGETTVENTSNRENFKNEFVTPHLDEIRSIYPDRQVKLMENSTSLGSVTATASAPTMPTIPPPPNYWGQNMIQSEAVWNQNVLGEGVLVGVVDSFIDVEHVQLKSRIAYNTKEIPNNGLDDDENGFVDDYAGMSFVSGRAKTSPHGTHVTGIIAADPSMGNMKGTAPKALIIPAPFISDDGSGSLADAVTALNYVASRGAKVINASWGGSACVVEALKSTFEKLNSQGILLVVAAGNDGSDLDQRADFPASFNMPNQITVAASTATDYMASWSNSSFNYVHLAAPGDYIYSIIPGNTYDSFQGTSMAAPFVSGAAALLISAAPTASAAQIKEALLKSVDITPQHEFRVSSHGRLNVKKALDYLRTKGF